ncbi:MAG TPA: hypothetical protein PKW90_11600 [Myxococcota bacterium]|nr:hypothetical protein [Myxococcota bacterium]
MCGAPSAAAYDSVPLCKEHYDGAVMFYGRRKKELEGFVERSLVVLREHIRNTLIDGKMPL